MFHVPFGDGCPPSPFFGNCHVVVPCVDRRRLGSLSPLTHLSQIPGDDVCDRAVEPNAPPAAGSDAVLVLARRMVLQLAKPLKTTVPITDPRVRLKAFGIPLSSPDTSGRWGHDWPASRLTGDDMRRLAVLGNYAKLPTNEILHVAVGVLYEHTRALMLRLLDLHDQSGKPFVQLLDELAVSETDAKQAGQIGGNGHPASAEGQYPQANAGAPNTGQPSVAIPVTRRPSLMTAPEHDPANDQGSLACEAAQDASSSISISPTPMAKRNATTGPCEGITDERVRELEDRMQRLQETMDTLIGAIDEFRDDLVHTLRNLPDRIPPPLHIHSLPLDPTDPEFGERVNCVPLDVMARLRDEAVRGREGGPAVAAAAEGEPAPAPMLNETPPDAQRPTARQPRLFA